MASGNNLVVTVKVEQLFEWLVWSNEHRAWWREHGCGYTHDVKQAGRYDFDEAAQIIVEANEYGILTCEPSETLVPVVPGVRMFGVVAEETKQTESENSAKTNP